MSTVVAFMDEFGTTGLDISKEGVSSHYVISAVLTDSAEEQRELEERLCQVSRDHFGGGEIKSRSVGKKDQRRIRVLSDLVQMNFEFYALVVVKERIRSSGLTMRGNFYKYCHKYVEARLLKAYDKVVVICDKYGDGDFMSEFRRYVYKRHPWDLFVQRVFDFTFAASYNHLLGLADFLCGTIARKYDASVISNYGQVYHDILRHKSVSIEEWPPERTSLLYTAGASDSNTDYLIWEMCQKLAAEFIATNANSKNVRIIQQCECLERLLYQQSVLDPAEYVSTKELLRHIADTTGARLTEQIFRLKVIAKLRDAEVIIASSRKGYKIPSSVRDLYDFVNRTNSVVTPMLGRLRTCREHVKRITRGSLDLLDPDAYKLLRVAIDGS